MGVILIATPISRVISPQLPVYFRPFIGVITYNSTYINSDDPPAVISPLFQTLSLGLSDLIRLFLLGFRSWGRFLGRRGGKWMVAGAYIMGFYGGNDIYVYICHMSYVQKWGVKVFLGSGREFFWRGEFYTRWAPTSYKWGEITPISLKPQLTINFRPGPYITPIQTTIGF